MAKRTKTIPCQNCGKSFTTAIGSAKFCPACRPEMYKRHNRRRGRSYAKGMQPEISINDAIRMTMEAGKSYGKLQEKGVI